MKQRRPFSQKLIIQAVIKYGVRCQFCQENLFEQIHHIDQDPSNNDIDNLKPLCSDCHSSWHTDYNYFKKLGKLKSLKLVEHCELCLSFKDEMARRGLLLRLQRIYRKYQVTP